MPLVIKASLKFTSPIKPELCEHMVKAGTPAFGSVAIIISLIITFLFFYRTNEGLIAVITIVLFFLVGFIDDFLKVKRVSSDGLKSLTKLLLQIIAALIVSIIVRNYGYYTNTNKVIYYVLTTFYIVFIVNGVNITDGLDGLATKCSIAPFIVFAFCFNSIRSISLIALASYIAFLYYNAPKASVFMGDAGSHMLGSILALIGLLSTKPFMMALSCGVFALELLSSFIQIFSIRVFKRKVFSIAPIHHALEKKGYKEEKICDRFACISFLFSILSVTLFLGAK